MDTLDQMETVVQGLAGERLRYTDLIAPNGLASGREQSRECDSILKKPQHDVAYGCHCCHCCQGYSQHRADDPELTRLALNGFL